jgi:hypothetical protein
MKSVAQQSGQFFSLPMLKLHRLGGVLGLLALVGLLPILVAILANMSGLAGNPAPGFAPSKFDVIDFSESRSVGVQEARALIASGALVLDARPPSHRLAAPVANVQPIDGIDLARDDATLTAGLRAYGISAGQPVVVVGDPADSNKSDETIVEALRSLGHVRVVRVEGGLPALRQAGFVAIYPPAGSGDFTVTR